MNMALQNDDDIKSELDTVRQYLKRRHAIETDIQLLKDDLRQLNDEFKEKLDMKTLKLAIAVAKAKVKVSHKFTFENFLEVLEQEGWADSQ